MQRNPFFTKERASFYFEKIEYYYKNKAYDQALSEIENNKDLLGAVLNVGKQLSLNKIYSNSIVNFMLDVFEVDGNTELFDENFLKYKTTLELHTDSAIYATLQEYHIEKNKNSALASRKERLSVHAEDTIGEYIDTAAKISSVPKQKDNKSLSIEEDFLNSIGQPLIVPSELKEAVRAEEKKIYGPKDDFDNTTVYTTMPANKRIRPEKKIVSPEPEKVKIPSETEKSKRPSGGENPSQKTNSSSYVSKHQVSKSGGKVTELEFSNSESDRPRKKSSSSKAKSRKKKKSAMPLVLSLLAVIIISGSVFAAFKTGMFDSLMNSINKTPSSQVEPEVNTDVPPVQEEPALDPEIPVTDTPSEPAADSQYLLPSDVQYLTEEDLSGMDKAEIRFAINEMYARKGWHFDFGGEYYNYFMEKSWYKPDKNLSSPSQAASSFSEMENVNLATIVKYRDSLN